MSRQTAEVKNRGIAHLAGDQFTEARHIITQKEIQAAAAFACSGAAVSELTDIKGAEAGVEAATLEHRFKGIIHYFEEHQFLTIDQINIPLELNL